jgi:hypothetical protein
MQQLAKRRAPHRPVRSARVAKALDAKIKAAARASGRTLGEEMIWRVEQSFEWERQFGSIRELQAQAQGIMERGFEAALRDKGFQRVSTSKGALWAEPGVLEELMAAALKGEKS